MRTLSEFIEQISCIGASKNERQVYRGHSDRAYAIKAAVFRDQLGLEKVEDEILMELETLHPEEFNSRKSTFDRLVHAQHHGLPTRLLDVSFNPLVALFFCVETLSKESGSVIVFNVDKQRIKNFESDALSLVSNLAKLQQEERDEITYTLSDYVKERKRVSKMPATGFNKLSSVKRLIQFVKMEKPYFENKARPIDLWSNFLALPARNSPRLSAQSGAFIASGVIKNLARSTKFKVEKIEIPASAKATLKRDLDSVGINRRTLYPGLESTAQYLKEMRRT